MKTGSVKPPAGAEPLEALIARFDPEVLALPLTRARVRLQVAGGPMRDVLLEGDTARLVPAGPDSAADAVLRAGAGTWEEMVGDPRAGFRAYERGHLSVRRNLHLGIGLLVATAGSSDPSRPRFRRRETPAGQLSFLDAGTGDPVILLHGLGATLASMLPTVGALVERFRCVALDLPGSGESAKPIGARYDARYFADAVVALMDELDIGRAHLLGNSMGGRVALEVGLRHPGRTGRLALLAPSLAWKRGRGWAPLLRLLRPELGLVQPAPRAAVEPIVRRVVPGARSGWAAAGVDEFLRCYSTPRGRAAFYAAARNIYLEEPSGPHGFWTRLPRLAPPALFVWGLEDRIVPIAFARHVERILPRARHVELDCGHVPQLERPAETHRAVREFLAEAGEDAIAGGAGAWTPRSASV